MQERWAEPGVELVPEAGSATQGPASPLKDSSTAVEGEHRAKRFLPFSTGRKRPFVIPASCVENMVLETLWRSVKHPPEVRMAPTSHGCYEQASRCSRAAKARACTRQRLCATHGGQQQGAACVLAGPRQCLGRALARILHDASVAQLISHFSFQLADRMGGPEGVDRHEVNRLTMQPGEGAASIPCDTDIASLPRQNTRTTDAVQQQMLTRKLDALAGMWMTFQSRAHSSEAEKPAAATQAQRFSLQVRAGPLS